LGLEIIFSVVNQARAQHKGNGETIENGKMLCLTEKDMA